MAIQWINLFDLPGAEFIRSLHAFGFDEDGVIHVTSLYSGSPFSGNTGCPENWGAAGAKAHTINLVNTEGYAFTGRHRVVVLHASSPDAGMLTGCNVHLYWSSGGWVNLAPPAALPSPGIYTYEAEDAPCLALLDGEPDNAFATTLYSAIQLSRQGGSGNIPCDIRYRIEFEVDFDPPPPPPFWQDFIGCKEIT